LQSQQLLKKIKGVEPAKLNTIQEKSLQAFNMMDQEIDWSALDAITEYLEVKEIDLFIDSLLIFKEYQDKQKRAAS